MIALTVIALRVLVPFTIFRWPLLGGVLALAADFYDFVLLNTFGWGVLTSETYQPIDKIFDIYYLSFEFLVALRWNDLLAKKSAAALFSWRLAGIILFELTQMRKFLFFAPNIFEYFYLTFLAIKRFRPEFRLTKKILVIILVVIGIPKLVHEYILHYLEYPLGFRTIWEFLLR
jgi:uncharacterized membrane protein YwzB